MSIKRELEKLKQLDIWSLMLFVLYNFQNMIYSEIFVALGEHNSHLINTLIQMISIVLICFMFFFIIIDDLDPDSITHMHIERNV